MTEPFSITHRSCYPSAELRNPWIALPPADWSCRPFAGDPIPDSITRWQAWIARWFDNKAKPTASALATLKQVAEAPVNIAVPDINASLAAVRTARAAREKR